MTSTKTLVVDTETTGFTDNDYHRLHKTAYMIQLGLVVMDDSTGEITDSYFTWTIPRDIEGNIKTVPETTFFMRAGLTNTKVHELGIEYPVAMKQLRQRCKGVSRIVAHNMDFDQQILTAVDLRSGADTPWHCGLPLFCTMRGLTPHVFWNHKWPKLGEAWDWVHRGVEVDYNFNETHNAASDAKYAAQVLYQAERRSCTPTLVPLIKLVQ